MNMYRINYGSRIAGSNDSVYIMAESEQDALEKGRPMLNTNKLVPSFLNSYGRYSVEKV